MTHNMRLAVLAAKILLEMETSENKTEAKPKAKPKAKAKSKAKSRTKKAKRSEQLFAYMKTAERAVTPTQVATELGISVQNAYNLLSDEVRKELPRIARLSPGVYAVA